VTVMSTFAGFLAGGCALVSTPHRPLRLSPAEPRASAVKTTVEALAEMRTQQHVRGSSVEIHPEFTLAFVEFDDQGRFWNRNQLDLLDRTLETENKRTDSSGVAVILFAHGWRHDSSVCDPNVVCFRSFLMQGRADSVAVTGEGGGRIAPKRIVAI